ncbi:MAG TPA: suppressor of fused domain protein, partial [Afifellaceae bacterium]|nr:suppressor of fused domain protein [Afifellaceae bacterium]
YVSYGMSSLYYDEESAGGEFSRWGFEFTFRLAVAAEDMPASDKDVPLWPINVMQNLARYVFETQKWFEQFHFIPANGPIKLESDTKMVAMLFCLDPELGSTETPHGKVDFLQMVGLTQDEIDALFAKTYRATALADALSRDNPLLITDLARSANAL